DAARADFPFAHRRLRAKARRRVVAGRLFFSCYLQGNTGPRGPWASPSHVADAAVHHYLYAVSAGRAGGTWVALLPLFTNATREAELEHRVYALQAALAQCKGVARSWWSMRVRFTVAVALVAMAAGFALGVYRHPIKQAFVNSAVAVGLASPADAAAEA